MPRRLAFILTVASAIALIVLNLDPVTTKLHRLVILCSIAGLLCGPLILFWKNKFIRLALLALPLIAAFPFLLPGKRHDPAPLRQTYLENLTSYKGTTYHWGGENSRGIDCSGLPRKALRDAMFSQGIKTLNGTLTRGFLRHWWNDSSAKALAEGHLDFAHPTGGSGAIAKMSYANLEPGDLAITEDRRHILIFLGGENWIQADPGIAKVTIENGRTSPNGWFAVPTTIHRWTVL